MVTGSSRFGCGLRMQVDGGGDPLRTKNRSTPAKPLDGKVKSVAW
jgi:hypothetical protein